jgi:hypothetical protein
MLLSIKLIPSFKHKCPDNMFYEVEEFKKDIFRIWICYKRKFDYNNGKPVKCVWGFYSLKKCKYFAPVNSITVGKEVSFGNTTPFSSMQIKKSPLEAAFG